MKYVRINLKSGKFVEFETNDENPIPETLLNPPLHGDRFMIINMETTGESLILNRDHVDLIVIKQKKETT